MKKTLLKYYEKYPKCSISDFVKLVYQIHFGSGHFIKNYIDSFNRLENEITNLNPFCFDEDLYEYIGECFIRVNLRPYLKYRLSVEHLNESFIESSKQQANFNDFLESLSILKEFLLENNFDFNIVREFFDEYQRLGYPALHHSEVYKLYYQPSYRIIKSSLITEEMRFYQLKQYLDRFPNDKLSIIALEGKCASGKTTISKLIEKEYKATIIHTDDFFDEANEVIGINNDRIIKEILSTVKLGCELSYQKYNCTSKSFASYTVNKVSPLLILEGVYSGNKSLRPYYDGLIFLEIDEDQQMIRLNSRSKTLMNRFLCEWIPREKAYLERENIKSKANLII